MTEIDTPIAELLPHTGAMVLLDRLLHFDEAGVATELTVRGDGWLFGDAERVPAWAGIEYMAQTVGVYAGLKAKQAGEPIRLGFLLGTRRYLSNVDGLPVGARLTVEAAKILQEDQLGVFECRIRGDNIDISATLNVFQPDDLNE